MRHTFDYEQERVLTLLIFVILPSYTGFCFLWLTAFGFLRNKLHHILTLPVKKP